MLNEPKKENAVNDELDCKVETMSVEQFKEELSNAIEKDKDKAKKSCSSYHETNISSK